MQINCGKPTLTRIKQGGNFCIRKGSATAVCINGKLCKMCIRDSYTTDARPFASAEAESEVVGNGKVIDLVLPVIVLIICCIIGMIYTGGFFDGESFIKAFAHCSAPTGCLLYTSLP